MHYVWDDGIPSFDVLAACVDHAAPRPRWWSVGERRLSEPGLPALVRAVDARGERLVLSARDPDLVLHGPGFDGLDTDGSAAKIRRARAVLGSDRWLITSDDTWRTLSARDRLLIDVIRCTTSPGDVPRHVVVCATDAPDAACRAVSLSAFARAQPSPWRS